MSSEGNSTGSAKVFDFRCKSLESPETMVEDKVQHLEVEFAEKRKRSQTCPEQMQARFPKAAPVGCYSQCPSPRPGHYDPRMPKARPPVRPGHYDPRIRTMSNAPSGHPQCLRMRTMSGASRGPMSMAGGKPVISHAQLVREAFICKTAQEMMKEFTSTVLEVKVMRGARVMWTSVPEDLKFIFNVTDIKTVDSWKQTMHGDVQLDISMFKAGDKIKMFVQSVGVSGKHMHQPLIRGVPNHTEHPETLAKSNDNSPRIPTPVSRPRSRAGTVVSRSSGEELMATHERFCAKKPEASNRFARSGTATFSDVSKNRFTANSMLKRSRTFTAGSENEAVEG